MSNKKRIYKQSHIRKTKTGKRIKVRPHYQRYQVGQFDFAFGEPPTMPRLIGFARIRERLLTSEFAEEIPKIFFKETPYKLNAQSDTPDEIYRRFEGSFEKSSYEITVEIIPLKSFKVSILGLGLYEDASDLEKFKEGLSEVVKFVYKTTKQVRFNVKWYWKHFDRQVIWLKLEADEKVSRRLHKGIEPLLSKIQNLDNLIKKV